MANPTSPDRRQESLYRVALDLDSLLVNGIQFGILNAVASNAFAEKLGKTWCQDLDTARKEISHLPDEERGSALHVIEAAAEEFRTIIELANRLGTFKGMTSQELSSVIAQIVDARNEGVRLIEEMERCFHVAKPFYRHRSAQSAAAVDSFLANLETMMLAEWSAARTVTAQA